MNALSKPPKWPDRLLNWLCRPDITEEIQGDLHEAFYWRVETKGLRSAKLQFIWECIRSIRPSTLKSVDTTIRKTMIFRNYLKIALRNLQQRKSMSFINILGLATGVAAFILILLYAIQVLTFDDFHKNKKQIFLAYKERITPDGTQATYDTWVPMKDRMVQEYPEIISGARVYTTDVKVIKNKEFIQEDIIYSDPAFFDIFSFSLAHGNPTRPFQDKSSIVINQNIALKYFGKSNAVGEEITLFIPEEDTTLRYYVSGVLHDFPTNTSLQPSMIIQMDGLPFYPRYVNNWGNSFLETYLLLDQSGHLETLEGDFPDLIESIWGAEVRENTNFKLLPYGAYYDLFVGSKSNARTLLYIGLGILLIAIINFTNLSTAQATQRSKEIGLRKVLGAYRGQLRVQFLTESFLISLISTIVGVCLALLSVPYFNEFFNVQIDIAQYHMGQIMGFSISLILLLSILSGGYPALYLSSIKVLDVLRQKYSFSRSTGLRNALVIIQFTIAVFLISATLLIREQVQFMSNRDMGFEPEETLIIHASAGDFTDQDFGIVKLNSFKNDLKSKSYIREVSISRSVPTLWTSSFLFVRPDGWNGDPLRMRYTYVDANFFETYNIKLIQGSHFLDDSQGNQRSSVILNEAAMNAFEFNQDQPNVIKIGENSINVVGIVENFNYESLQHEVAPTLIFHRTADHPVHNFISCKLDMQQLPDKLNELEGMWLELGATKPLEYSFMNDRVKMLYASEMRYMALISLFTIISIIIACMGLYGLTLFVIQKRRKEISIRKVLGAEANRLVVLIFRDFARWVLIAFLLGVPMVVYFMDSWLAAYHYRIDITWTSFIVTLLSVVTLVLITVGYQSLNAAFSNPVEFLKEE